ncbi:MAG: AI-2E family transporter [Desulfobacterales bacterium]
MQQGLVNKSVVLLLTAAISLVFLGMVRNFLMAIFMAAIFAALLRPIYTRFSRWWGGRTALASLATLLLFIIVVLIPLGSLLGIVTAQAFKVGQSVSPWIQDQIANPSRWSTYLQELPYYDAIAPYRETILEKIGALVGSLTKYLIDNLSSAAKGTVNFLFMVFIFLYTMFFFLIDGDLLLQKIMYYLPLGEEDERRIVERFTSVTRATLKGTATIGALQGGLAGLAFMVVGIEGAAFWGTVMIVLSIIPAIGSGLVWAPAGLILILSGHYLQGAGLLIFCGVVVGSVDNFLRPRLVGKDTQMHELFILFGTLGGIMLFGILGFIIGPIIAALFVTVWDIYGVVFKDVLPTVTPLREKSASGQNPVPSDPGSAESE